VIALADDRQYYGFLAAESLGQAPALNDKSTRPDVEAVGAMQQRPPMQRLIELYAIGDRSDARREWAMLLPNLDPQERAAAAYLIADIGWIDLHHGRECSRVARRPVVAISQPVHADIRKESRASAVPISFLYGVARQESAFAPAARSSAGALGLMQLMPATAAATARNAGEPIPLTAALFDPVVNVHVASRHLAELLERYDGNRVLVAAAYNAGSHRGPLVARSPCPSGRHLDRDHSVRRDARLRQERIGVRVHLWSTAGAPDQVPRRGRTLNRGSRA
jgi:soluble lytic murein transglycosylase